MASDFTPTGVDAQVQNLNKFLSDLGRMDKGMQQTGKSASGVSKGFSSLGKGILGVGKIAAGAAVIGVGALGAGIAAAGVSAVKTAISFESAFAGVTKTVDGLTSGIGQLNDVGRQLREGFVGLSKEVPLAFEELAAIGELGGQLGIGKDALLDFTETVAGLGVATNLSTEEAGAGLARLSNIFNVASEDMGSNISRLGSTLVDLGNNFATTERDILAYGERLAGAGAIAGLTQADVLAIGAAMSSVGVQAEAGGTATQKVLLAINNAVVGAKTGFVDYTKEIDKNVGKLTKLNAESARLEAQFPGLQSELLAQKEAFIAAGGSAEDFGRQLGDKTRQKALEVAEGIQTLQAETDLLRQQHGQPVDSKMLSTFARTAELSATEFQELWRKDASEAFRLFVEGLGKQGDDAINTLADLGLEDQRLIRSFLSLSGAGDLLERTLKTGNDAFEENTALANEAAQRYATTESKIAILKNTFRAVGDAIGTRFLPIINRLIDSATAFINDWVGPIEKGIDKVMGAFERFGVRGAAISILGLLGLDPSQISDVLSIGDQVRVAVEGMFAVINDVIAGFQSGGVGGAFGALFSSEEAGIALQGVIDFISQFLADNWPIVQTQLNEWGNMFFDWVNQTVVPAIPDTLSAIIEAITTWAAEQLPVIQATTQEWATGFWDWIQGVVASASTSLAAVIASIGLWAQSSETQSQLTEMGFQLGEAIALGLQNMAENQARMVEILTQVVIALGVGVLAITGLLIAIGGQILAGIVAGIIESITGGSIEVALISNLTTILGGIANQVLTIASIVGTNILLGISQGILDGIAELTTTVEQIGIIIVETVKTALGISSPSTLFFQFGLDIVQGLIDGIMSLAGTITETIGSIFGSLFGGGDEESAAPTIAFDPAEMLAGIETVNLAIENMNLGLSNISTITLPLLGTAFLTMATIAAQQLMLLLQTGIMPVDLALVTMYTATLPTLQSVTIATSASMVAAFTLVQNILNVILNLANQISAAFVRMGQAATQAGRQIVSGFKGAEQRLRSLIDVVGRAAVAFNKLAQAARDAAAASRRAGRSSASAGGMGFAKGLGFQAGTPSNVGGLLGLGFKIPGGFPGDSFGPMFAQSGEEMLITPRGMSIESLIFSRLADIIGNNQVADRPVVTNITNNFDMTVNTGASAQAVVGQFNVMRAFIGD